MIMRIKVWLAILKLSPLRQLYRHIPKNMYNNTFLAEYSWMKFICLNISNYFELCVPCSLWSTCQLLLLQLQILPDRLTSELLGLGSESSVILYINRQQGLKLFFSHKTGSSHLWKQVYLYLKAKMLPNRNFFCN